MVRFFLLLMIPILFLRCTEEVKVPENVLDKEMFSDLICEFTLAESAATLNVKNVPFEKFDSVYAFNPLHSHNISRPQYDTSLYFYSRHPQLFREVYELTLEKLSKFQSSRK
jgi:hypothetical protein